MRMRRPSSPFVRLRAVIAERRFDDEKCFSSFFLSPDLTDDPSSADFMSQ